MTRKKERCIRELESVVHDAADGFSETAVAALVAHPEAVRSALAVVANTLSPQLTTRAGEPEVETLSGTNPQLIDTEEADRQLSARTRQGGREALLTSDQLAARVGLKTRQSVHEWLRKGKIIGWRGAKRGYVFPAEQIDERCRPLAGLDQIVPRFGDGYAAWVWLTTPRPSLNGAKPLALMRRGETERVTAAAKGDLQGDFA
ncbi:MAG: DUF2384 domain-containing protein [Spirochaetaceae bacterium]|nr:DUF2384 domain-containing protein [Spirochaetaceae bacterium]